MIDDLQEIENIEAKYQRAAILEQGILTKNLVLNDTVFPNWVENTDSFWYERSNKTGKEFRLINARTNSNEVAFDHKALARALAAASKQEVNAENLPINNLHLTLSPLTLSFKAFENHWVFKSTSNTCKPVNVMSNDCLISPNGTQIAFVRDNNLWVRELASGEEHALTQDGEELFVYGAVGTAWGEATDTGVQARWSPDSKHLFTVQRDTRHVKTTAVVNHVPQNGCTEPTVTNVRIARRGDSHIETYRLLTVNVENGQSREANYRHIPVCRNGWGFFNANLGWWASDSRTAYFIDQERGDQTVRVVEFDTHSGATRILFEEVADTQINLSLNSEDYPPHVPLPDTSELIWYSERSGWAHLYLYDLVSGELKNTITQGEWVVRDVLHVDTERREVLVQTAARVVGRDPYYRDICRVSIDTGDIITLLSTDDEYVVHSPKSLISATAKSCGWDIGENTTGVAPSGDYIVTTRSRADQIPVSLLLDREGRAIMELEVADITGLPVGWQWPEPVELTAADGKTDIYGLLHRPSDFSENTHYPIINCVFNGPDVPAVSKGSFLNATSFAGWSYLTAAALAELGFIVVVIDSRGTSHRHKAFLDESYGWAPSSCRTEDHIAGIQQLAQRYPYMDVSRVGIISPQGFSGGLHSLLEHPDFYKVGVIHCPQDSRLMPGPVWTEKYEDTSIAGRKYPEDLVNSFQGKLLLTHGMLDTTSPPATTFRLAEALQKANKDFDMLMLPNLGHYPSSYLIRRSWDYLVKHLLDKEPPKEFKLISIFGD